jgi:hypothetical protein
MFAQLVGLCLAVAHGSAAAASGGVGVATGTDPDGSASAAAELPALVAYPPPKPTGYGARPQGRHYRIWLQWEPVPGAFKYHVQLSRTLDLERRFADTLLKRTHYTLGRQRPGVYFARVRAVGPAGEGTFGRILVIDALGGGSADAEQEEPALAGLRRSSGPGAVGRRRSPGRGRGRRQRRARQPSEASPALPVPQQSEAAEPQPDGAPAADVSELSPRDADVIQLAPVRLRLRELRRELAEVYDVRAELEKIAARLQPKVRDASIAEGLEQLRTEIQRTESKRLELLDQIQRTEQELNSRIDGPEGREP